MSNSSEKFGQIHKLSSYIPHSVGNMSEDLGCYGKTLKCPSLKRYRETLVAWGRALFCWEAGSSICWRYGRIYDSTTENSISGRSSGLLLILIKPSSIRNRYCLDQKVLSHRLRTSVIGTCLKISVLQCIGYMSLCAAFSIFYTFENGINEFPFNCN